MDISIEDAVNAGRLIAYDHLACIRECIGSLNQVCESLAVPSRIRSNMSHYDDVTNMIPCGPI